MSPVIGDGLTSGSGVYWASVGPGELVLVGCLVGVEEGSPVAVELGMGAGFKSTP